LRVLPWRYLTFLTFMVCLARLFRRLAAIASSKTWVHFISTAVALRDPRNMKNSGRSASPRLLWVLLSSADRDLFFRNWQVVAGAGAGAGSLLLSWAVS
jgi:hypothetical protein